MWWVSVAHAASSGPVALQGTAWSLLPPLLAIGLALALRKVVPALAAGALAGALVAADLDPLAALTQLWGYLAGAVWDLDHFIVTAFSLLVAATVGILVAAEAIEALVARLAPLARGPRGAMVTSWLAGGVVFFDDYANCLVVGQTMGPLADRFKVSRAKLAYIVDATAAPVASMAVVSTWVGYQVGLIDDAMHEAGIDGSGFSLFLEGLPYQFYGILTLVFVGAVAAMGRDFGPMLEVERAARQVRLEEEDRVLAVPPNWLVALAVVPIVALVVVTFAYLLVDGSTQLGAGVSEAGLAAVLGEADAFRAMLTGAAVAAALAVLGTVMTGKNTLQQALTGAWQGMHPVFEALVVLYLAWTLGSAIHDAGAAEFLTGLLGQRFPAWALPGATFLLAALTAFATGTSFGTMGILIPLVVPLAHEITGDLGSVVALASIASVLAGSTLGDHASPISDTTVLSALGSGVDVLTHVRTQVPYVITVGILSVLLGYLPVGLGVPVWALLPVGAVATLAVVRLLGTEVAPTRP